LLFNNGARRGQEGDRGHDSGEQLKVHAAVVHLNRRRSHLRRARAGGCHRPRALLGRRPRRAVTSGLFGHAEGGGEGGGDGTQIMPLCAQRRARSLGWGFAMLLFALEECGDVSRSSTPTPPKADGLVPTKVRSLRFLLTFTGSSVIAVRSDGNDQGGGDGHRGDRRRGRRGRRSRPHLAAPRVKEARAAISRKSSRTLSSTFRSGCFRPPGKKEELSAPLLRARDELSLARGNSFARARRPRWPRTRTKYDLPTTRRRLSAEPARANAGS